MNCAEVREYLSATVDGEAQALPPEATAHLQGCAECRQIEPQYRELFVEVSEFYSEGFRSVDVAALLKDAPARAQRFWPRMAALAAVLAVALLLGWVAWPKKFEAYPLGRLPVPADQAAQFDIAGARVWVEAGSVLSVESHRQLSLQSGSAFFQVEKGQGPFSVTSPHGTVRVLGTEFVVTAQAQQTLAAVQSGSVQVENKHGTIQLSAAQASVAGSAAPSLLENVDTAALMLWRPWSSLSTEEHSQRLRHLCGLLSSQEYSQRLSGRMTLAQADLRGFEAALGWYGTASPRLRLELMLAIQQRRQPESSSRQLLKRVALDTQEPESTRLQALRVLGEIGIAEDLTYLSQLTDSPAVSNELTAAATEAARNIQLRK